MACQIRSTGFSPNKNTRFYFEYEIIWKLLMFSAQCWAEQVSLPCMRPMRNGCLTIASGLNHLIIIMNHVQSILQLRTEIVFISEDDGAIIPMQMAAVLMV